MAKTSVHAACDVFFWRPLFCSILIAPAYDASNTAHKFPQFQTHTLSC